MRGPSELSELPASILAMLERPLRAVPAPVVLPTVADDAKVKRARAYLAKMEPAISGSGGHAKTFEAALVCKGFDLSEADALALLSSEYNPRCQPTWTERELRHKVDSAYKDGARARGYLLAERPERPRPVRSEQPPPPDDDGSWAGLLEDSEAPEVVQAEPWRTLLRFSNARTPTLLKTAANVAVILENDPRFAGVIGHNVFSDVTVIRKPPPFPRPAHEHPAWNDTDDTRLQAWIEREHGVTIAVEAITRGVSMAARTLAFHPVRDYLGALKWDGVPRLDSWLTSTFGSEATPYTAAVGAKWMISAVARVLDPGSKVDTVLVLEGDQGVMKSTAILTLCGSQDWFLDELSDVANKDAAQQVAGRWIVEVAEMDTFSKSEWSGVKAFISRQVDRFRPAFGRHVVQQPRQCAFVGTINPGASGYLRDETGNRRFWPVLCPRMADIAWLRGARDQLWAEAMARYNAGEVWHIKEPEIAAAARTEQEARAPRDAWQERLEHWLIGRDDTTVAEVLDKFFNLAPDKWTQPLQASVGRGIAAAGFLKTRLAVQSDGRRPWVYRRNRLLL